jgi:hypothetical protein
LRSWRSRPARRNWRGASPAGRRSKRLGLSESPLPPGWIRVRFRSPRCFRVASPQCLPGKSWAEHSSASPFQAHASLKNGNRVINATVRLRLRS